MPLASLLDLFVDRGEHFLVLGCSLGEVDDRSYHLQGVPNPLEAGLSGRRRRYSDRGLPR